MWNSSNVSATESCSARRTSSKRAYALNAYQVTSNAPGRHNSAAARQRTSQNLRNTLLNRHLLRTPLRVVFVTHFAGPRHLGACAEAGAGTARARTLPGMQSGELRAHEPCATPQGTLGHD